MYQYSVRLDRVIDGDTVVLIVDLGFSVFIKETFRLTGINCPELLSPGGLGTRAQLYTMNFFAGLPENKIGLTILSDKELAPKREKYGRWLATIYRSDMKESLNSLLLSTGNATRYPIP